MTLVQREEHTQHLIQASKTRTERRGEDSGTDDTVDNQEYGSRNADLSLGLARIEDPAIVWIGGQSRVNKQRETRITPTQLLITNYLMNISIFGDIRLGMI